MGKCFVAIFDQQLVEVWIRADDGKRLHEVGENDFINVGAKFDGFAEKLDEFGGHGCRDDGSCVRWWG